jgi:hypothetical protein
MGNEANLFAFPFRSEAQEPAWAIADAKTIRYRAFSQLERVSWSISVKGISPLLNGR